MAADLDYLSKQIFVQNSRVEVVKRHIRTYERQERLEGSLDNWTKEQLERCKAMLPGEEAKLVARKEQYDEAVSKHDD